MLKFLGAYLAVTGGLAALVMLMPGLVTLGFFLLIIPGLILVLAPTAFLWGLLFTGFWLLARTLLGETLVTALVAGAATAALLVVVTVPAQMAGKARYRASLLREITPADRIAMHGDVRLDVARPGWDNENTRGQRGLRGFSCDKVCLGLLFTPGVTSVTINRLTSAMADVPGDGEGLDVEARSYQLVPTAQCPNGGLTPEKGTSIVVYSQLVHKLQAFDPEWEARLANEVCLVRMDTLRKHDMLIRDGTHGKRSDDRQFRRTLSPRGARVQYTEIHDSGTVVLRRFKSSVWVPAWPLRLLGNDNIFRHDHFDWSLKTLTNRPGEYRYNLLQALLEQSNAFGQASKTAAAGPE